MSGWKEKMPVAAAVLLVQAFGGCMAALAWREAAAAGLFVALFYSGWAAVLLFNASIERRALRNGAWPLWQGAKGLMLAGFGVAAATTLGDGAPHSGGHAAAALAAASWALAAFCLCTGRSLFGERVRREERLRHATGWRFSPGRLAATGTAFLMLVGAIAMGGSAGFVNVPSAIITLGIPALLLYANYGRDFLAFSSDFLLALAGPPPKRVPLYAEIAAAGSRYVLGAGVLGMLIGLIQMLRNLEDPSSIGMGLAVSLLTVLYSVGASEFGLAFMANEHGPRGGEGAAAAPGTTSSPGRLLSVGVAALLVMAWIALAVSLVFF